MVYEVHGNPGTTIPKMANGSCGCSTQGPAFRMWCTGGGDTDAPANARCGGMVARRPLGARSDMANTDEKVQKPVLGTNKNVQHYCGSLFFEAMRDTGHTA